MEVINPFDFFIEEYAEEYRVRLPEDLKAEFAPYLGRSTRT